MIDYQSSITMKYKNGYIFCHSERINGKLIEIISVSVDQWAYRIRVKSVHQAKLWITKHCKKYGG